MTQVAGEPMRSPSWFQANLTLGNVLVLATLLGGGSFAYGQLNNKIDNLDAYRTERSRQTDAKFAEINAALRGLPELTYRVTAQEEALKATNARVDTSLQNISARLAEINQALGGLSTSVAVLTQRFETAVPKR